MATYRKLSTRVKKSKGTGSGAQEVYKPDWFAYDKMESFLHTIYTPRKTKTSDTVSFSTFLKSTPRK